MVCLTYHVKKHKESHKGKNATSPDMIKQTREVCLTLSNQYCHVVRKKNQGKFLGDVLSPAAPILSSSLLCSTIVLYDKMCPLDGATDASFHTQWRILIVLHMVTVLLEYLTRLQNLVYRISVCLSVCGEERRLSVEWYPQPQPVHGAKIHWRDKARQEP